MTPATASAHGGTVPHAINEPAARRGEPQAAAVQALQWKPSCP
ncbi:hypothetical protein [Cupriavidus necator]